MLKWFFCLIPLLSFQCSPKVVNFTNDKTDFSQFHSYRVINYKTGNSQQNSSSLGAFQLLESEISKEMNRRNYALSNISPDLLVRYELISNQNTETRRTDYNYGYYVMPNISTRTFISSVLLIEIIDLRTKKNVWQASVDLKQLNARDDQTEIIKSAVRHIYNTYLHIAGNKDSQPNLFIKK